MRNRGVSRGGGIWVLKHPPQPLAQGKLGSTFYNSWDRPCYEHLPPNNPGYAPEEAPKLYERCTYIRPDREKYKSSVQLLPKGKVAFTLF